MTDKQLTAKESMHKCPGGGIGSALGKLSAEAVELHKKDSNPNPTGEKLPEKKPFPGGKPAGYVVPDFFTDADTNKDKGLNRAEIDAALKNTKNEKAVWNLKDMKENFDKIAGKDGKISFPELYTFQSNRKMEMFNQNGIQPIHKPKC